MRDWSLVASGAEVTWSRNTLFWLPIALTMIHLFPLKWSTSADDATSNSLDPRSSGSAAHRARLHLFQYSNLDQNYMM